MTPDSGVVVFDGTRIDSLSDNRRAALRRSDFGFVFQFPGLLPELSGDENVALPLMLSGVARPWEPALRDAPMTASSFREVQLPGLDVEPALVPVARAFEIAEAEDEPVIAKLVDILILAV